MIGQTEIENKVMGWLLQGGFEEDLMQKVIFLFRKTPRHQVKDALVKLRVASILPSLYRNWAEMDEPAKLRAVIHVSAKEAKALLKANPHLKL